MAFLIFLPSTLKSMRWAGVVLVKMIQNIDVVIVKLVGRGN